MHQGETDLAASDATDDIATTADPFHSLRVGRKAGVELTYLSLGLRPRPVKDSVLE